MRKIIINFSILIFIIIPTFAMAQSMSISMVPVVDPSVINQLKLIDNTLDTLSVELAESFKEVNNLLSKILETQFQQIATNVVGDSFKVHQYLNNVTEIETFVKERKQKAADQKAYSAALQEAQTAGAYLATKDFIKGLNCVNPRIRDRLAVCLSNSNLAFNTSPKAIELLKSVPDCPSEGTTTTAVITQPSFFAWLTKPFEFNLAGPPGTPGEISPPSITITPAFQESEDSTELNNLCATAETTIPNSAQEKEEERKKTIGNIWPEEECSNAIADQNIDGGRPICLEYSTLISGEDMERFKQEVSIGNPLNNPSRSADFLQSLSPSVLTQIGITTSTFNTSSDISKIDIFKDINSKAAVEKKINEYCSSYNAGPSERGESILNSSSITKRSVDPATRNKQTAYAQCLNEFTIQYGQATKILEKDIENKENMVNDNQNYITRLLSSANALKPKINVNVCPGASEDLEDIIQFLKAKQTFYINASTSLVEVKADLVNLESLIEQARDQIFNKLDEAFSYIQDILPFLNLNLEQLIKRLIDQLLTYVSSLLAGVNLDIVFSILDQIKIGPLKVDKDFVLKKIVELLSKFNNILGPIAKIVIKYNQAYTNLYQSDFLSSSFLNDTYEFNLISQKLKTLENAIAIPRGNCSSTSSGLARASLIKNQVIVVESKKEQKKSFNFFALLKNMFRPKIVEIRNEK